MTSGTPFVGELDGVAVADQNRSAVGVEIMLGHLWWAARSGRLRRRAGGPEHDAGRVERGSRLLSERNREPGEPGRAARARGGRAGTDRALVRLSGAPPGPRSAPTRGVDPPEGSQAARGGRAAPVGALVPATGRYAVQGAQVRAGLELWASRAGTRLLVEDDRGRPEGAARLHAALVERGCRFVLGPYGSDSARAVAAARPGAVVWNHGAAADDVQRLPGVVSVPSPASRYLLALGRAVAALRPAATIALVTATGRFARFAREGLVDAAPGRMPSWPVGRPGPKSCSSARWP